MVMSPRVILDVTAMPRVIKLAIDDDNSALCI